MFGKLYDLCFFHYFVQGEVGIEQRSFWSPELYKENTFIMFKAPAQSTSDERDLVQMQCLNEQTSNARTFINTM